jgi:hypothetical protein
MSRVARWAGVFAVVLGVPNAFPQAAVETVDLLARANGRRHGYYSQFTKKDGAIHTPPAQRNARLLLPATIPTEYELLFEVMRGRGKGSFGVGPDRFLFGTDFPICSPALLLQGVLFEHLSDAEQEAILGGNFGRLVGWEEE